MELTTPQRAIVSIIVVLVLLALLGLVMRQIRGGRLRLRGQAGGRQRQPRLGVVDTYDLDRQRQLVLIRRDNIEHLLMIGGASDVVVETNILRSGGRAATPSYVDTAVADRPLPPFETLVPPSEPAMRAGDEARRAGYVPEGPEVLPPLPSRTVPVQPEPPVISGAATAATAGVAAALGVAAAETVAAAAKPAAPAMPAPPITTGPAPSFAREHAPPPAVSAGELDDMTRQLEEALKRPFSAVRPANLAADPVPESPVPAVEAPPAVVETSPPAPVVERKAPSPKVAAPIVTPPAPESEIEPVIAPEPVLAPPPVAPPRQKPIPSDVEAELAAALGLSLDRPIQKAPEPKPPEPKLPEPMPAETHHPEPVPAPEPAIADAFVVQEEAVAVIADEPAAAESLKPEPEPEKPAEPATKDIDPFSVDAIEAEFARLLGRDPKAKS